MQDVIFNGSANRKPVSRASVELIFDNTLGRAQGQWSQYSELSVKRTLSREGESGYYINNLKVRKKDITDLFLGTGLGPRAYAMIGQGMISRIIEARPEELRVFLEEAAGVTRYKERRRETQSRLEDTRSNLARIGDVLHELAAQVEHLAAQAVVARQYQELNDQLKHSQHLLWLLRRNEALAEAGRIHKALAQAQIDLEAQGAALRQLETQLENARQTHYAASDALHQRQSEMYEANATTARLESEIRHRRESIDQMSSRLAQLDGEDTHWQGENERLYHERERWQELQQVAYENIAQATGKLEAQREALSDAEAAQFASENALEEQRSKEAEISRQLQLEGTHLSHAERNLANIAEREQKLLAELAELKPSPQGDEQHQLENKLARISQKLSETSQQTDGYDQYLAINDSTLKKAQNQLQLVERELAAASARQKTLAELQATDTECVSEWLARYKLDSAEPLWRQIEVDSGWEKALTAVLRERLGAINISQTQLEATVYASQEGGKRPGSSLALLSPSDNAQTPIVEGPALEKLLCKVRALVPAADVAITEWLSLVWVSSSLNEALAQRRFLPSGGLIVTAHGEWVSRAGIGFYSEPDGGATAATLSRHKELEATHKTIKHLQTTLDKSKDDVQVSLNKHQAAQAQLAASRQQGKELLEQQHDLQMQILAHQQQQARQHGEQQRILQELQNLELETSQERERQAAAIEQSAELQIQQEQLLSSSESARSANEVAELALRETMEKLANLERQAQEADFSARECSSKLQAVLENIGQAERQLERIAGERQKLVDLSEQEPIELLEEQLQEALELRTTNEYQLAEARSGLEEATATLKRLEESRLGDEHALEPLRQRISELQLKEQAASLNAEQLLEQLREAGANLQGLAPEVPEASATGLSSKITRLQRSLDELGAVNLAALEELEAASERQVYLDTQASDLQTASETLESAIRRIDRETRELLQKTFDTVNAHFGCLFPELFGGGRAELMMSGEEILDAGVQVMAQPPGKKNSTIHLLSGGEKALTAIALVFAMFQLNPAPFCLLDEVDAPLDDANTERYCNLVKKMSAETQFMFISHNKISMEIAEQLIGVTMQESGVSRIVDVDIAEALQMREAA